MNLPETDAVLCHAEIKNDLCSRTSRAFAGSPSSPLSWAVSTEIQVAGLERGSCKTRRDGEARVPQPWFQVPYLNSICPEIKHWPSKKIMGGGGEWIF